MKKILSLFLSVVMIAAFGINAAAFSISDASAESITAVESEDSTVTPRFKYLAFVSAAIDEDSGNNVVCASTYNCMYSGYTFTLTCALQKADGTSAGWVNYKTASQTFTTIGAHGIERIWYAPPGYAYRTYTTIVIKNSSGTVVEKETCYSPTIYK